VAQSGLHFAESLNELHHLLIMEELGGNDQWKDRFVAQHSAFFYYWMIVGLHLLNPTHAYNLNQAVEQEAYDTYNNFLETHAEYLQGEPPAKVAVKYYTSDDMYLFDAMHFDSSTGSTDEPAAKAEPRRRPNIQTLYDVFRAIRDDEYEHVKTMAHLRAL
jgi:ubiquinol oxidase